MRLTPIIATTLGVGWTWDPGIVLSLALWATMYGLGVVQARRRPIRFAWTKVFCFVAGWLFLVVALISPLHQLGDFLFSAHMAQHEILMAVAAPLLVAGRPDHVFLWLFSGGKQSLLEGPIHCSALGKLYKVLMLPSVAWSLHALALLLWHVPFLFDATISHESIHALQHLSFLGTAMLFWAALLYGHLGSDSYGAGIVYVFTTAVYTSILGALLTFSASPWYSVYASTTKLWGVTPLEDQQIGGLIMWVPAGIVYIVVGLWLFANWIRESDRRSSFPVEVRRAA
jgi:putative membrane protein